MNISRKSFISGLVKLVVGLRTAPVLADEKKLKPVLLQKSQIAGLQFYSYQLARPLMSQGDRLTLKPEPDNKYDKYAIEVYTSSGLKLGYLPRHRNKECYNLKKQDIEVYAVITGIVDVEEIYSEVSIDIYQMI